MSVNERSQVNTPVGTVAATGIVTGFEITAGNSNNFFKISPTGKIQVAGAGLNYESKQNYTVALKVNLLPFKVNLSASPPVISNVALPALTASVITLLVFSSVETLFVVIKKASNESKQNYTLTVKITDDDAEAKTAQIIIQINRTRGAGTLDDRLLAFFITTLRAFINAHRLISSNANGFFFEVDNGNGNGFVSGQGSVFNF
jgi:hypothetical protein